MIENLMVWKPLLRDFLTLQKMFQVSLNLNIKQEESVFVVEQNTKIRLKVNPKDKKGKITRCVICDLTALAKKMPSSIKL